MTGKKTIEFDAVVRTASNNLGVFGRINSKHLGAIVGKEVNVVVSYVEESK